LELGFSITTDLESSLEQEKNRIKMIKKFFINL
jgi:hypothetical protein